MTDNYIERPKKELPADQLFPNSARQRSLLSQIQKELETQEDISTIELALRIWRLTRRQ